VEYIREKSGLYHMAGGGSCSRYEWAKEIILLNPNKDKQLVEEILAVKSNAFSTPVKRPLITHMSIGFVENSFFLTSLNWKFHLKLCLGHSS